MKFEEMINTISMDKLKGILANGQISFDTDINKIYKKGENK